MAPRGARHQTAGLGLSTVDISVLGRGIKPTCIHLSNSCTRARVKLPALFHPAWQPNAAWILVSACRCQSELPPIRSHLSAEGRGQRPGVGGSTGPEHGQRGAVGCLIALRWGPSILKLDRLCVPSTSPAGLPPMTPTHRSLSSGSATTPYSGTSTHIRQSA